MKFVVTNFALASLVALSETFSCYRTGSPTPSANEKLDPIQGSELVAMEKAPHVPPPIARNYATRVVIDIEAREHTKTLADGVTYTYWTLGEDTPGMFLRVREGDLVETHFSNHPDNTVAHNIDFHGATGPGGGGEATFVAPGHTATFTWRAMRAGLYVYHCVAAPAGLHLANGMYGLILVEPREGLPKVDREYFVMQGEFYTDGKFGEAGLQHFSIAKALDERPEYVVFNGHVGSLLGANAIKAKVGEKVRIYLGNAGPSLTSSFHIVGVIFDSVYSEGGVVPNQHNVQTTVVPVGGSAVVEFTASIPGDYQLVDHSMFRAFNKGAMGALLIEGKNNEMVFSGRTNEEVYQPGTHLNRITTNADPTPTKPLTHDESMQRGEKVFSSVCATCHQANAQGIPNAFPPIANSDFLMADKQRAIGIVLNGLKGEITVNGKSYKGEMPKLPLSEVEVASVLTFVRNSFGNKGDGVNLDEVVVARMKATAATKVAARAEH